MSLLVGLIPNCGCCRSFKAAGREAGNHKTLVFHSLTRDNQNTDSTASSPQNPALSADSASPLTPWSHSRKATSKVELALKRKQLEHTKQKLLRTRSKEKLAMLQRDRESMVVHAPAAGTVYYGQCVDGKWGEIASMRPKLRRHGKVTANEVMMTIVGDGPVYVAATVPEAHLSDLKPSMEAAVYFAATGKKSVKGRVESISSTLVAEGKYPAKLTLANNGRIEGITPGMTCKIKLVAYANKSALLIPNSAVVPDPWDEEVQHVILVDEDGNETKQPVKKGREKEGHVEILSGLKPGNKVLLDAKSQGE